MRTIALYRMTWLVLSIASLALAPAFADGASSDPARAPNFQGGGMQFGMRMIMMDPAPWNALVPDPNLPSLPVQSPVMHGGLAYVNVNDWFRVGLQGYGLTHSSVNDTGITELAGDLVGFFADARWTFPFDLQLFGGGTLSCGRLYFNSITKAGIGVRASSGAVYLEPYLGIGYTFFHFLETRLSCSYIVPLPNEDLLWYGPSTGSQRHVSPDGIVLTLSFGPPLPSVR